MGQAIIKGVQNTKTGRQLAVLLLVRARVVADLVIAQTGGDTPLINTDLIGQISISSV